MTETTKVSEQLPVFEDKLSEVKGKLGKAEAEREREQVELEKVKKEKEVSRKIAEAAKFCFRRCMDLLAVIEPELNFDLLQLGYRVQDRKIVRSRPGGAPLTDADEISKLKKNVGYIVKWTDN